MKSTVRIQKKRSSAGVFEIAFLSLPFLALTPNFFIIPDLTILGLATQELVFAIIASIFALIGLVRIFRSKDNRLPLNREYLTIICALAALIAWQMLTLLWAPSPFEGLRNSGIWLGFAVFFTTGLLAVHKRSAIRLYYSITAVCVVLAISLLYERAMFGYVMLGIFFNHGISSELIALILPLHILNYLCSEKRLAAIVSLAVSSLCFVALFVGMRRGAILGTAFVLVAIGIMLSIKLIRLQSKSRIAIVLALFVIAGAAVGLHFREEIRFRIQGATELGAREGGLSTRARGWITAWEMGKRHALFGVGMAGYPSLYGEYRKYFVSNNQYAKVAEMAGAEDNDEIRSPLTHNEYLQTFVELGIIGLLLFILFWSQVIRRLWQKRHGANNYWVLGVFLGLLSFGISAALSAFSLRFTPGAFILACVLSIGFAFVREETDKPGSRSVIVSLPKNAVVVCIFITLIACLLSVARTYGVFAGQKLQGRSDLSREPLDFAFYPGNPAGNEALKRRYEKVLDYDPYNAGAHLGYGLLLFQMKRPSEAIHHAEFALNNGYSRPFAYVVLAFAFEQNGELMKASRVLGDCVASFPQSVFARAAYAEILRKEGKIDLLREQQTVMYRTNERLARSWEMALRMKREPATSEAESNGLIPPDKLAPTLAAALVGMRAYHYLN